MESGGESNALSPLWGYAFNSETLNQMTLCGLDRGLYGTNLNYIEKG